MKTLNIKYILLAVLTCSISYSCEESIEINTDEGNKYQTSNNIQATIISQDGVYKTSTTSYRGTGSYELFIETTKPVNGLTEGQMFVDESFLNDYNNTNSTEYILFPSANFKLNEGGKVSIEKDSKKSNAIRIALNSATKLDPAITYALPLKANLNSSDITITERNDKFLLLIKDYSAYPAPGNVSGIKIISCMEVNDCNPLNNLSFTLKSTGQPLFDMVILFSSNINYSAELARPYIHHNTEMTNILADRDKYIKPLQDRGIKVMLSLLGNWDRAGVANMSESTAKMYAQEIKNTLDTYGLDGVMFDDEYTSYAYENPYPGFVIPSSKAAGDLLYETKKAIGDKLVFSYVYSVLNSIPAINNTDPGKYVDYALSDYFAGPVSDWQYPGMVNKQKSPWSQEFARGYFLSLYGQWYGFSYEKIVEEGYGAHMIFAMDPNRSNFERQQLPEMQKMAEIFCKDELVYDGIAYPADHK